MVLRKIKRKENENDKLEEADLEVRGTAGPRNIS
jgi:hypothetical protein